MKENDRKEFNNDRYNITLKDSINENKNKNYKINNSSRINNISNRKKERIIKCNNYEADIIIKNNSLDLNPLKTEGNIFQDKFNSTTISLENKIQTNHNSNNYKKYIFQLQKEFNL